MVNNGGNIVTTPSYLRPDNVYLLIECPKGVQEYFPDLYDCTTFHNCNENLADLLIERQSSYFSQNKDENDDLISAKLRIYTNCLKQLATSNIAQQLNVEPLRSRLISKPWCLAYQIIELRDENKERIFKIGKPSDIYLDDDHQYAIDLRSLCAPDESELTKLYEFFGSKCLSETVKRTLIHRGLYLLHQYQIEFSSYF
ncbi:unnamed protein product [Rotaria sp. Silwood2]|nr:unnamed protein product [Rotaria sp. Silwood2]